MFLTVVQSEKVKQGVEHIPHTVGGLLYVANILPGLIFAAFFHHQSGIAFYCSQRCAQFMGDGMHRFLPGGYECLVLLYGLFQLFYQISCLALVLLDARCITVYNDIRNDQQQKDKSH